MGPEWLFDNTCTWTVPWSCDRDSILSSDRSLSWQIRVAVHRWGFNCTCHLAVTIWKDFCDKHVKTAWSLWCLAVWCCPKLPRTGGLMTLDVLSSCRLLLTSRRGDRFELIWTLQGRVLTCWLELYAPFFPPHFFDKKAGKVFGRCIFCEHLQTLQTAHPNSSEASIFLAVQAAHEVAQKWQGWALGTWTCWSHGPLSTVDPTTLHLCGAFWSIASLPFWFASHPPDDQRMNYDHVNIGIVACEWGCRKTSTCFILWLGGLLVPGVIGNTSSATISFKTACWHRTVAAWSSSVVSLASRSRFWL